MTHASRPHHHVHVTASTEASAVDPDRRSLANRRVVLKAAAGMGALAASGIGVVPSGDGQRASAQEVDGTRAGRFVPAEHGIAAADAAQGSWVSFQADFPFWALGASWPGDVGLWPLIAVQLSSDGETWTDTIDIAANTEDGGQPNRDDRLFTPLVFTDGAQWVRYQTLDADRVAGEVADLSFSYIDPTDGPWEEDIVPESRSVMARLTSEETIAPPEIVTRAQWGANENWRFDSLGEVWPPEYSTVSHIIIHHTATVNRPADVPGAIRSIYYYHAVEQGWGDIGYNYLVDHNGRIYQGRYGGQDVIGGHSYQFAIGSSGISTIGNFMTVDISEAAKSALVSICAWVGRDLDPLGEADFHEAPNLPIISSHRDVNSTTCPGDRLWNDLPELRTLVNQTLDSGALETEFPAGIVPGDRVKVQTDDGSALNLRGSANGTVTGSLAHDSLAWVIDGPEKLDNGNWYRLQGVNGGGTGWATAQFLIVDPPLPPGSPTTDYPFGLNLRILDSVNIRRTPSLSAGIVATAPRNTWAHVLAGPTTAEGYSWYQIRAQGYGDGWVVTTAIAPAPFNDNPDGLFEVGDTVRAKQSLNIRPRPGLPQGVIASAPTGSIFVISQEPVEVTGYIWYGAYSETYGGGWIAQDYLEETAAPPAGKFEVGDTFRISQNTNLRSTPTTSGAVIQLMGAGVTGSVLAGPRTANGYTWWQVRLANGATGWSVENWMVETDGGTTPPPTGKFETGDTVRVTERVNLRSSASTSGSVITVLNAGVTGTVLAGPTSANGYTWWRIQTSQGTGWAVQDWLVETTTPEEPEEPEQPGGKFEVGDAVRITERANMRTGAGTSNSVIRVLQVNETASILGGPSTASGFTWWRVQTSNGAGWVIEDVLVAGGSTTPPPSSGYPAGTIVRVTENNLRLRSSSSTSATVLAVLPTNHRLTVVSGPTSAGGYTWYRVTSATAGTGYVVADFIARV